MNGQKLDSKEEREKSSVYVNNTNVATLEKGIGSNSPKLFDSEVGLKLSTKKLNGTNSEKKLNQQYDKIGKTWIATVKEDRLIDQWI